MNNTRDMDIQCTLLDVRRLARTQTAKTMQNRIPLSVIQVAEDANKVIQDGFEQVREIGKCSPYACKEGCAWCCYATVDLSVPELFRIVDYIEKNYSQEQLVALKEKLQERAEKTKDWGRLERLCSKLPCPLLVDNRCSIYPARPFKCQSCHSFDADQCKEAYESEKDKPIRRFNPVLSVVYVAHEQIQEGLRLAGLSDEILELAPALHEVLNDAGARERWLDGGKLCKK